MLNFSESGHPRTNETVQGNLLRDCERKFANLADHLSLIKLCSNVGSTKTVTKGHCVTTFDDAELENLGGSSREYIETTNCPK